MKKIITLTLFVAAISVISSCKKKDEDPAPTVVNVPTTPPVNQPSATAPSLVAGTSTSLAGDEYYRTKNISDDVSDPQGDSWSITSVSSSNTNLVTVEIYPNSTKIFRYVGNTMNIGTATLSITVADANGNTNVITYTVTTSICDCE